MATKTILGVTIVVATAGIMATENGTTATTMGGIKNGTTNGVIARPSPREN